jgi:hypothetical protein
MCGTALRPDTQRDILKNRGTKNQGPKKPCTAEGTGKAERRILPPIARIRVQRDVEKVRSAGIRGSPKLRRFVAWEVIAKKKDFLGFAFAIFCCRPLS